MATVGLRSSVTNVRMAEVPVRPVAASKEEAR
jgi:hypothetical protein